MAVKNHKFFALVDWNRLRKGLIDSPIFPTLIRPVSSSEQSVEFSQALLLEGERNDFMGNTFVGLGATQE